MKKILRLILLFSFTTNTAHSQLTINDFKLCLDNIPCSNKTLLITKDEFLKSKKIIPNYSWFKIESAIVYIGEGNYTSEIVMVNLPKDEFTPASKKMFARLSSGDYITIVVKGHNKQNVQIEWGNLSIKIIDK